jgi:hypothetical protein
VGLPGPVGRCGSVGAGRAVPRAPGVGRCHALPCRGRYRGIGAGPVC